MEEYDFDEDKDEIEMKGGFKDLERTTTREIDISIYTDMIGGKSSKLFRSDIEIFITDIVKITKELIEINIITDKDQNNILENMNNLQKPEFKNATAYILGYIVSQGGFKLSKDFYYLTLVLIGKNLKEDKILKISNEMVKNKIFSIIRTKYRMEDKSVESPDIIRYGRLWLNMYGNL